MSKGGRIAFWISFPIIVVISALFLLFYLDLARVSLFIIIFLMVSLTIYIAIRVLIRNKRFYFRAIPTFCFGIIVVLTLTLYSPQVEAKAAVDYSNPIPTQILHLEKGDIRGVYNDDKSVEVYAGIPYAKAPIGELRWKEPQEVEKWDGVKECSTFAANSMQAKDNYLVDSILEIYASSSYHPKFKEATQNPLSEDSLYLNIWRPANNKTNLPILVYIHGGSLNTGSSYSPNIIGEEMAKKDVIMITIQYRLGIFGYFAHDELQKESPNNTTGNYGLLDQIKAIEWVNKNASYFGGDKNNITIAGESAGSSSVSAICASPLAKGLFKRAIGESSSVVVKTPPHTYRTMEKALKMGSDIMKEMDCTSIEEMRSLSASKLLSSKYKNAEMTLDGYALTKDPYDVYLAKENNEEALLNGFNVKEADAFVIPDYLTSPTDKSNIKERLIEEFDEEFAEKIYKAYEKEINKDAFKAFNEIYSVYWFIHPHYSWSNMASNNNEDVYEYYFTKENGHYGTYHSGEIIYAYGNVKNDPYSYRYDESDEKLSEIMLSYWSNFIKYGNPNGENLPSWNKYSEDETIQELGANVGPIEDKYSKLYPIIDEYIDYRQSHPKIEK